MPKRLKIPIVQCPRCHKSNPFDTNKCIHCGGMLRRRPFIITKRKYTHKARGESSGNN